MKKILCVLLCVALAFCFISCKNGAESSGKKENTTYYSEYSTNANGQVKPVSSTDNNKNETNTDKSKNKASEKTNNNSKKTKQTTTTPMPKTNAKEAVSISRDDALKRLKNFYGSAYQVEEKEKKGSIQHYEVSDSVGNLYARVEVNLKTSDVKETVVHSGEVNEFNLLV